MEPKLPHGKLHGVWVCVYCRRSVVSFAMDTWIENITCSCQMPQFMNCMERVYNIEKPETD